MASFFKNIDKRINVSLNSWDFHAVSIDEIIVSGCQAVVLSVKSSVKRFASTDSDKFKQSLTNKLETII